MKNAPKSDRASEVIARINLSAAQRAAAIAQMQRAEAVAQGVVWLMAALSRSIRFIGRWVGAMREHGRQRRRDRRQWRELLTLDEHSLRDLGLSRGGLQYAFDHGREDGREAANSNAPELKSPRAA